MPQWPPGAFLLPGADAPGEEDGQERDHGQQVGLDHDEAARAADGGFVGQGAGGAQSLAPAQETHGGGDGEQADHHEQGYLGVQQRLRPVPRRAFHAPAHAGQSRREDGQGREAVDQVHAREALHDGGIHPLLAAERGLAREEYGHHQDGQEMGIGQQGFGGHAAILCIGRGGAW